VTTYAAHHFAVSDDREVERRFALVEALANEFLSILDHVGVWERIGHVQRDAPVVGYGSQREDVLGCPRSKRTGAGVEFHDRSVERSVGRKPEMAEDRALRLTVSHMMWLRPTDD